MPSLSADGSLVRPGKEGSPSSALYLSPALRLRDRYFKILARTLVFTTS